MRLISATVVFCSVIVAALSSAFVSPCSAQFDADYQTNVISGVVSNWVGSYFVGSNTVFDLVRVENGGVLTNGLCYIGYGMGADNNRAVISGSGSAWHIPVDTNGEIIRVGWQGSGNTLIVSNQGAIVNMTGSGIAGDGNIELGVLATSSNNFLLITDPGSLVSNLFYVSVGRDGSGNTMVISNGGAVVTRDGYVGELWHGVSTNSNYMSNTVVVTGAGSVWTNGNFMWVGYGFSSGNSLIIDDHGALITAGNACVGCEYACQGCGPRLNSALISNGGIWQSGYFSMNGRSNSVVVAGGTLLTTNLVIGPCDNFLKLDSGSVIVTNATTDATLDVQGKLIQGGGVLQADKLVITNACARFIRNGGTLIVGNLVLDPNMDADGDGIPNGYEQSHGLDPLNAADTNLDSDGDGQSNLAEYLAGTDPTNSASALQITSIAPVGSDLLVTWATAPSKTNALQSASTPAGAFADIFTVSNTTGSVTNYLDPGAATNFPAQFYRIRLVP